MEKSTFFSIPISCHEEILEYYHLKKGYMLIFNFNKNGKAGIREVTHDNKNLTEAMV